MIQNLYNDLQRGNKIVLVSFVSLSAENKKAILFFLLCARGESKHYLRHTHTHSVDSTTDILYVRESVCGWNLNSKSKKTENEREEYYDYILCLVM